MVSLVEIQTAYYMIAATGVLVAAAYYVMSIRTTQRNMKQTLETRQAQFMMQLNANISNKEAYKDFIELMNMERKDFDDFYKKYDSTVDTESYAKRMTQWNQYEMLGVQYKAGILDFDTLYALAGLALINMWIHFKPIIEEYRKFDYGEDTYRNWEYLADEFARIKAQRDPSWKGSSSYIKSEEYDNAFKR